MARAERSETALQSNDPKGEARGRVIPNWGNRLSGGTSRRSPWLLKHVHSDPA